MKIFIKELKRWEEVTPENIEIFRKFGYLKEQKDDATNREGESEPAGDNVKRTRKRKSTK